MGSLLSSGVYKRTRASLITSRENAGEFSRKKDQEKGWEGQVARPGDLTGFLATATMIIAGPILMGAPKD
jgi:hypothetical protein